MHGLLRSMNRSFRVFILWENQISNMDFLHVLLPEARDLMMHGPRGLMVDILSGLRTSVLRHFVSSGFRHFGASGLWHFDISGALGLQNF
jgi:hypothetical protein